MVGTGAFLCRMVTADCTATVLFYPGTVVGERLLYLPSVGVCLIVSLLGYRISAGNVLLDSTDWFGSE